MLRDQHLADREQYFEELEEAICKFDSEQDGRATVSQIFQAFAAIDPEKPKEQVEKLLRFGICRDRKLGEKGYPRSNLREDEPLPSHESEHSIQEFLQHLRKVSVVRSSKSTRSEEKEQLGQCKTDVRTEMLLAGTVSSSVIGSIDP